jgi:hypothetical protein
MPSRLTLDTDEIPLHYESSAIGRRLVAVGWLAAVLAIGVGVVLAAGDRGIPAEVLGVLLAAAGGVLTLVLARCRRFESVVTERLLTVSAGPLRRRVPVGFIERVDVRPARSWRRLYASKELVLDVGHDGKQLVIPTTDPEELASVLEDGPAGVPGTIHPDPRSRG